MNNMFGSKMMKPIMRKFAGPLVASMTIFFAFAPNVQAAAPSDVDTYRQLNLLIQVFERVRSQYVEEVDDAELLEAAIHGMLRELDPHSGYMGPESFRESQIQQRGEYGGLGMEVISEREVLRVIAPFDDTPASRAGVQAGDYITHIDGESLVGLTSNEAVDRMRGPKDTPVSITIVREGLGEALELTLIREIISISAVRTRTERDQFGYIRLTTFNNEKLSNDLAKALGELEEELGDNLKGLVLDLRNNPGGLLDQAVEVSDLFLDKGSEITSMRGRNAGDNMRWAARTEDVTGGLPIIVLVNAGSASASEIVTGALQDHKRATIIGERTFGKGVVQTLIPLGREQALRLTTARYYTPAGTSIQAVGIEPDIFIEQPRPEGQKRRVRREADLNGHIANPDEGDVSAPTASEALVLAEGEEIDPTVDYQLRYALDLLEGVVQVAENNIILN